MPNNDAGLRIGIEGEKEFKAGLRDINSAIRVLGSEMTLAASQFDKQDKSVAALTARNAVLTKEIDAQKDKISTLKDALDNAATSFGENDKRTLSWQQQLNKAQAELNNMERELEKNNAAIKSHADRYDDLGREIEETVREYVKVRDEYGKNSAEAKALEAKLKELGVEHREAGKAADAEDKAVSDVTKSLGLYQRETGGAAKETSTFGETLKAILTAEVIKAGFKAMADMVKAVGSAVKDYVAEGSEMAKAAAESQTLLTQVMRNMMDASDDQVDSLMDLVAAQEKVGVVSKTAQTTALAELASFVERREALEDMLPVMNDYIAYQYGTAASSEQARNVATSLGKAIMGNIDGLAKQGFTLTDNEKKWFKTATEAERVAFVMDMVSESMEGVNEALAQTDAGKMAALNTVLDNTKIAVGQLANEMKAQILGQMLPSISSLSEAFLGVMRGEGSVEDLAGAFTDVFQQISSIIEEFLPRLAEMAGKLITALVTGLADNIDLLVKGAMSIVDVLIKAIIQLLPVITDAGTRLLFGLLDGLIRNLPAIATAAVQMVSSLANALASALPQLVPAAMSAVATVVETLITLAPQLVMVGMEMMSKLAEGLGNAIPLLKPLTVAISAIMDVLKALAPFLVAAAAGFAAFQIVSTITNMMKGMSATTLAQTVATTAQTIATNIAAAAQWLWNAAMMANPIGLIIAGVVALIAVVAVLVAWFSRETEEQKALKESTKKLVEENDRLIESVEGTAQAYADRQRDMAAEAGAAKSLADKIADLSRVENKSAEQKQKLAAYVDMLNEAMGETVVTYDEESDALSRNMSEIYGRIDAMKEEAKAQAARERAVEIAKEQMQVEEQLAAVSRQRAELDQALADGVYKKGENDKKYKEVLEELNQAEADLLSQQGELAVSFDFVSQAAADAAAAQEEANAKIVESTETVTDALTEAQAIQEELSNQKIAKEQEVTDAMIAAASAQGITLDEYKANLKKTEDSLKQYTNATTEMFKKIDTKSKDTAKSMADNLKHNQKVTEEWSTNLINLSERGIRGGLLDKLQAAGPESASLVQNLVNASDKELAELQTAFENGTQVATDALMKQLGLPDVVNSGSDMVDNIAQGVDENARLKTATENLIKTAKATASSTVSASGFGDIGNQIVNGVWQGIQSREAWFRSQVSAFFKRIVNSVKSDLGIQSPSRVFAGIGENMAQGLGVGFGDAMNRVAADMQSAIPSTFDAANSVTGHAGRGGGAGGVPGGGINVTQNIYTPQYDYAAQQLAAAREFRQIARQLA